MRMILPTSLIEMGADVLISINASPFNKGQDGTTLRNGFSPGKDGEDADSLRESGRRK